MEEGADLRAEPLSRLDGILHDDEVHVWQVDLIAWEKEADSLLELLDPEERARAARFKFPGPRNQFLISRALLRRALGRYLGIGAREVRFRTTANGKPELAANSVLHYDNYGGDNYRDDNLRFNLSHTEGVTVFALARHRQVGIDVERIRKDTNAMELAERFFSHNEVQWLRSQPAAEQIPAFFTCWTGKEAYIKAHGEGLSMPLNGFGVLPVAGGADSELQLQVYDDPQESKRWSIWQLELGSGLRAALAVAGERCRVRVGRWPLPDAQDLAP
jgi:4'-phosphopantetheinyl transferase